MIFRFGIGINVFTFLTFVARLCKYVSHLFSNVVPLKGLVTAIRTAINYLDVTVYASSAVKLFTIFTLGRRPDDVTAHLANIISKNLLLSAFGIKGNHN